VPALIDESLREITRQLDVDGGLVLRRRLDDGSSDDDDGGDVQAVGSAGFADAPDREALLRAVSHRVKTMTGAE
jgi:hypothetical protein